MIMKPKTRIQKEIARLSKRLPRLTEEQKAYAFRHCFKHYAIKRANGTNICTECGHSWKSGHDLADTICGCACPYCGMELEALRTRKSVFSENEYFSIVTTCKQYQVIRFFFVKSRYKAGQAAEYSVFEVVQRWIAPNGKTTTIARLRGMSIMYYDLWNECSDMEVRKCQELRAYDINPICTYPRQRFIPELKRNGFKGDFHGISPVRLFKALLSDPRIETLMKGGEIEGMKYFLVNPRIADECWASYLIAKRHKYQIDNLSMWCDYLRMLKKLGQDLRNPKSICPEDFIVAHDNATRKIEALHEKERAADRRRWEAERREREQQRQLQRKKDAEDFIANKSKFFGLVITDEEIIVKVLESIDEYYNEGKVQNICVFGSEYYKKADTLILSARIGSEIIETVEVDLRTLKVVQCHGKYNQDTEYHERIIDLVNKNATLIRERMKAA